MKSKLISITLIFTMIFTSASVFAQNNASAAAAEAGHDVLREVFGSLDDIDKEAASEKLPYKNSTVLSDVREPLYAGTGSAKIFGNNSSSWSSLSGVRLKSGTAVISGKSYSLTGEFKLLAAAEGDLSGSGKKAELALIIAAKKSGGSSLMLLCTAAAKLSEPITPIIVLHDSAGQTSDFYGDTDEFINSITIACADMNGDGFDEIITTSPTSGYTAKSTDKYGFDKFGGSYLWYLNKEGRTENSWKNSASWCSKPHNMGNSLPLYIDDCHIGTPGVTASIAAGDINGDGFEDVVTAISTTNAHYTNRTGNMFTVYYIAGAAEFSDMYLTRKPLTNYIGSEVDTLHLGPTSGDAAGFDVEICDIDGTGKPTIFLSFKETLHHYAAFSGERMLTPSYYVFAFDYNEKNSGFNSSPVYHGGIYHNGWHDGVHPSQDPEYVYKTKVSDCAPVRIGVLRGDFGLSGGKTGYVSSGTIIAERRYISFVRYPDGDTYRYETQNSGTYISTPGNLPEMTACDYPANECVMYNDGINIYDIRTASVSFDGETYEDAAIALAKTTDGYSAYYLSKSGNGYTKSASAALLENGSSQAVIAVPDVDNDSIYLKYNKHEFFWADPVVIAALASPPYFDCLPSDMYTNSQTTYGRSTMSASGNSESFTIAAGAYVSTEIKAGGSGVSAVFEAEGEALKSSSIDKESARQVTYTQSFSTSGGEDTIVLTTVGYDAYAYTAYYPDKNGALVETPYIVYVPRGGSGAVRTASLNYDNYLELIPYSKGALPTLDNVFRHTIGKPETYLEPSGANVLSGSVMKYPRSTTFPSNLGCQTLTIDITEETTEETSAGSSVSAKLGGGIEAEAEGILGYVDMGTKITGGSVSEKEFSRGKITTSAVGTSFEGTVFGQGDGFDASAGSDKANFNWRLMQYVYKCTDEGSEQQFPVVTYITSNVNQPRGVIPTSVKVTPLGGTEVEQVGAATPGFANKLEFSVKAEGVSREASTVLEGAPLGMTLDTEGNIGTSSTFYFNIKINGNVMPGSYELRLVVGGVPSDPFTVTVTKYQDRIWLEGDKTELDFGSSHYRYSGTLPAAAAQTVAFKNIHTETLSGLAAEFAGGDESPFSISTALSGTSVAPNQTVSIGIAPKRSLPVGTHTDTLIVSNGKTAAFVTLKFTVTNPILPGEPDFNNTFPLTPNPIKLNIGAPIDDGGGRMLHYLYTLKGHPDYMEDGEQVWKKYSSTAQSGSNFNLEIPTVLTVGEKYTVGVKAVTDCGEGSPGWFEFTVCDAENDPAPVSNAKAVPGNSSITVTWDPVEYWGANEFVSDDEIYFRRYMVYIYGPDSSGGEGYYVEQIDSPEVQITTFNAKPLQNGSEYTIDIQSCTLNRSSELVTLKAVPTTEPTTPSRPTAFKAVMEYKKATLSWEDPTEKGGSEIIKYKVSNDGGESWTDVGSAKTYTFENLQTNKEYDFRVFAVNASGEGDSAKTVQTAPSSLPKPTFSTYTRGYEQVEVEWEKDTSGRVIGYQAKTDNGEWQDIQPLNLGGKLHYVFTGLSNDKSHLLYLRGVDSEGGGNALSIGYKGVTPTSEAPRFAAEPYVKARNNGFELYSEPFDSDCTLSYNINGGSWYTLTSGNRIYCQNGEEYVIGISVSRRNKNNETLRTVTYITASPDATVPDPPSDPEISAVIGEDYITVSWTASDGGSPILYYNLSCSLYAAPVSLSASQTSYTLPYNPGSAGMSIGDNGLEIEVEAVNAVGSSSGRTYISSNTKIWGSSKITVLPQQTETTSSPYQYGYEYTYIDEETGEWETFFHDYSNYADWSLTASSDAITWDSQNNCIVINGPLAEGEYEAVISAKDDNLTYKRTVKITVGDCSKIISAEAKTGGISVKLSFAQGVSEAVLCTAAFNQTSNSRIALSEAKLLKVTSDMLVNGEVFVPINTSSASMARIMLVEKNENMRPLCESLEIPLVTLDSETTLN